MSRSFRRDYISRPIFGWARKVLPEMSDTEREALEAGDVWWDADLFAGNPDWNKLLAFPRATLTADLYGNSVRYSGHVAGLGVGTGAAFALLPPQNATGNWIKVVQRIPVRIALDPEPLAQHPLRLGLSMLVTVDTRDQSGATLATAPRAEPLAQTSVFAAQDGDADAEIARIIAANLGGR